MPWGRSSPCRTGRCPTTQAWRRKGLKSATVSAHLGLKNTHLEQCCQTVYFRSKSPNLGNFWKVMQWKMLEYFHAMYVSMSISNSSNCPFVDSQFVDMSNRQLFISSNVNCQLPDMPIGQHVNLSTLQFVDTSIYRHFNLSTLQFVDTSIYRHFNLSTLQFIDTSICRPLNWMSIFYVR
jgi:hypothetical protein